MVIGTIFPLGTVHANSKGNTQRSLCKRITGLLVVAELEVCYLRYERISFSMITKDGVEVSSLW